MLVLWDRLGEIGFMVWRRIVPSTIALLSLLSTTSNDKSPGKEASQLIDFEKHSQSSPYSFDEEPQRRGKRGTVGRGKKIWNVYPSEDRAYYTVPYAFGSVYSE